MVNVRKSWLSTSLQDPAFFASASSHYTGRYSLSSRQGDPQEALLLRMDAISLINKRITEADGHLSDGTIGAVASLVTYESNNGTLDAIRTHMAGLNRMIELRGGFQRACFPPSLQRLIGWAELTAVNVLTTPSTIPSLASTGLDLPSYHGTTRLASTLPCPDSSIKFSVFPPKSMPEVFADLRYLSSVLESKNPLLVEHVDGMWYSDKVYLVQRSLVSLSLEPEQAAVHTACCIAGTMYVNSYLRDMGFYSGVTALLVTKLKNFLGQNVVLSELSWCDEEKLRMGFWILVIGGISAMAKLERGWFVEHFRSVRKGLKLETQADAEDVLGKMVWSKDLKAYFEELWHEAAEDSSSR